MIIPISLYPSSNKTRGRIFSQGTSSFPARFEVHKKLWGTCSNAAWLKLQPQVFPKLGFPCHSVWNIVVAAAVVVVVVAAVVIVVVVQLKMIHCFFCGGLSFLRSHLLKNNSSIFFSITFLRKLPAGHCYYWPRFVANHIKLFFVIQLNSSETTCYKT